MSQPLSSLVDSDEGLRRQDSDEDLKDPFYGRDRSASRLSAGGGVNNSHHRVEKIKDDDDDDDEHDDGHHKAQTKTLIEESLDFEDLESVMWRKHQMRRFFQDRGHWWTSSRKTTAWKWLLVVACGVVIAFTGVFVQVFTEAMTEWKFESSNKLIEENNWGGAFFAFIFISIFLGGCSGYLCWLEPLAAGSGIPEIKAFLNGVNLSKVVKIRVLVAKVLGMCFSCSAGLPLGKEGPMIHAGAIIGAVISQGNRMFNFGFDTSWTKFQDLRNDTSKRDFVTYGAAAGVAAAFKAPIGGILFTLEEGASFWSTSLTFRAFFCAMVTQLVVSLMNSKQSFGRDDSQMMFAFGQFDNLDNGSTNYRVYELFIFIAMGAAGGVLGSLFNHINEQVSVFRMKHVNKFKWKRMSELIMITALMAFIAFILSVCWVECTPIPLESSDWTVQEVDLLKKLARFQCEEGYYNQLASLYFVSGETAMRQLFHFREYNGTPYNTFDTGSLVLFFIPYYLIAAITSGVMAPAGLFVPTLLSGAAFGRIIGHLLNSAFPGYVADSGTYALVGAAAMLGGMARMTIAGTVIVLEACGNMAYLLPLMLVFGASRYTGNAINEGMYDMQIHLKEIPFLEGSLHSLGLLNYHPISELMETNVITLKEVDRVGRIYHLLKTTKHHGFPVVNEKGVLRGFILRKTLTTLLKLKAFSQPVLSAPSSDPNALVQLAPAATVFYDTVERNYPDYPPVEEIKIIKSELLLWLDLRSYYDASPYTVGQSASVQRAYKIFRTMGLRHLIVTDPDNKVVGIITRQDVTEHRLHEKWHHEGSEMQKHINVEVLPPSFVNPNDGLDDAEGNRYEYFGDNESMYADSSYAGSEAGDIEAKRVIIESDQNDSPLISLRKAFHPDSSITSPSSSVNKQKEPKSSKSSDRK